MSPLEKRIAELAEVLAAGEETRVFIAAWAPRHVEVSLCGHAVDVVETAAKMLEARVLDAAMPIAWKTARAFR